MASNYPTSLDNFTNPTSNDSLNSPSHSLQHANINDAVEAIEAKLGIGASTAGSAVSGYVLTAGTGGTTTWQEPSIAGLTLVKSQTIGSAVSSVEVTGAFSSTYDVYKIVISGGVSSTAGTDLSMKLGSSTTGYYCGTGVTAFSGGGFSTASDNNASQWTRPGNGTSASLKFDVDLINPFLAKETILMGFWITNNAGGYTAGFHNVATSYTSFTITPSSGTLTGGEIRVYGYKL